MAAGCFGMEKNALQIEKYFLKRYTLTDEVYRDNIEPSQRGGAVLPISADILRGHTDTIILTQLMEKDSYGYEINKNVQKRTQGQYEFKEATLYTAFKRMEQNGWITAYRGEDGPGARRRYYAITDAGREEWKRRSEE